MEKIDKKTELLLYIISGVVSGLLAYWFITQPYNMHYNLGNNLGAFICCLSAFFFFVLILVKLEKAKKIK